MSALRTVKPGNLPRFQSLAAAFLILFCSSHLQAQVAIGGGQEHGGAHGVEVHLTDQHGDALSVIVKVEVLTDSGLRIAEAYTNREQGVADLQGFNDGFFKLRISGPEIETVNLDFEIYATESTHREYVRVDLKNNIPGTPASPGTDPSISTQDLSVPDKARDAFEKGMEAYAKGDYKEAEDDLLLAVSTYPDYVRAHNNLGVLYLRAGLKVKAFVEFSKTVGIDPKFAPGYINMAKVSISDGNFAEAEPELQKALAANPSATTAMVLLCSTQFAQREYPQSLLTAHRVHQMTHDEHAEVHLVAGGILLGEGKSREAAAEYQLFVSESPNDPRVAKVQSLIAKLSTN